MSLDTATELEKFTGTPQWKDGTPQSRREGVRKFVVEAKALGVPDAELHPLADQLYEEAGSLGALGWTRQAVVEGLKSIPAGAAALGGAATDAVGITDTGSGARLKEGLYTAGDAIIQRTKQLAPGDEQEKRDKVFEFLKDDLDNGAYPPGFLDYLTGQETPEAAKGKEYFGQWQDLALRTAIAADTGRDTVPQLFGDQASYGRSLFSPQAKELLADYLATRDPNSWAALQKLGTETSTQWNARLKQESNPLDPRTMRADIAREGREPSLMEDLALKSGEFQTSPIDFGLSLFPLLKGAQALQAARAGNMRGALRNTAQAAAGEFASGAASSALEDPRNTAAQIAESGAQEAVGGGAVAGGMAAVGKVMNLFRRPAADAAAPAPAVPDKPSPAPAIVPGQDAPASLSPEPATAPAAPPPEPIQGLGNGEPPLPDAPAAPEEAPSTLLSGLADLVGLTEEQPLSSQPADAGLESITPAATSDGLPSADGGTVNSGVLPETAEITSPEPAAETTTGTPAAPPAPDAAPTVAAQVQQARSAESTRAAVLFTPGTPVPDTRPRGLEQATTPHGLVWFNPKKTTREAVAEAGKGETFDGALLGLSSQPVTTGDTAVTASLPGAPNVQAELVSTPEQLPAAIAAAEAAAPGATVEVKPAAQVLDERAAAATVETAVGAQPTSPPPVPEQRQAGQPLAGDSGVETTTPAPAPKTAKAKKPLNRPRFKKDPDRFPLVSALAATGVRKRNPLRQLAKYRKEQRGGTRVSPADALAIKRDGFYDDFPTIGEFKGRPIAQDALRQIFREGATQYPDTAFEEARGRQVDVAAEIIALRQELQMLDQPAGTDFDQQDFTQEERQNAEFYAAIQDGRIMLESGELRKGDELDIEGERVWVHRVEYDEDGYTTAVYLRDGRRFGRQTVEGNQALYVEGYTPADRPAPADDFGDTGGPARVEFLERQTDEGITAEREQQAARAQQDAARRRMQDRQDAPLTGKDETGQGALFASDADLFSGPAAEDMLREQDPFSKGQSKPSGTPGGRAPKPQQAAAALDLLRRNNPAIADKVRLVQSTDLSPDDYHPDDWAALQQYKPEGYYNRRTGETTIITDHVQPRTGETAIQAVARVVLHERVGHAGMGLLLQDAAFRRRWDKLVAAIPQSELAEVLAAYPEYAAPEMRDRLVEEWLARRAESAPTAPAGSALRELWDAIKDWLRRAYEGLTKQPDYNAEARRILQLSLRALARDSRTVSPPTGLAYSRPPAPGALDEDAVPEGFDINRYGIRLQADERLRESWRATFSPALYKTFTEEQLSRDVAAWIGQQGGLEGAAALFLDDASGLQDYERNALGQQLAIALDQRARRQQAAGNAAALTETEALLDSTVTRLETLATQAGQALRSFGLWAQFSPRGVVRAVERKTAAAREEDLATDFPGTPPSEIVRTVKAVTDAVSTATETDRETATKNVAERWIASLARTQSDTLSWVTARSLSALEKLIRAHMKQVNPAFTAEAAALGVPEGRAQVLDQLVREDHRRRQGINREREAAALIAALQQAATPRAKAKVPAMVRHLLRAAERGLLTRADFLDAYAQAFDKPHFTADFAATIRAQVERVQSMPEGSWLRNREQSRLMALLARHEGIPTGSLWASFWYANILSGLGTQTVNIAGSAVHLLLKTVNIALTSHPQHTVNFVRGLLAGAKQGARQAKAAFFNGEPVMRGDEQWQREDVLEMLWDDKPATWGRQLARYGAASWGRYVFRALTAADAFFWNTAKEGKAFLDISRAMERGADITTAAGLSAPDWASAQAQAAAELTAATGSASTRDIDRRAFEIVEARRGADITGAARRFGGRTTYNYEPEGFMGAIVAGLTQFQKALENKEGRRANGSSGPVNRAVFGTLEALTRGAVRTTIPFVRIVANLVDVNLDYTPVGLLRAIKGGHLVRDKGERFTPDERRERYVSAAIGILGGSLLYTLAAGNADDDDESVPFMIYGRGPRDPGRRAQMPRGWKPFSLKIGSTYVSFEGTPLAFMLGTLGTAMDQTRYSTKRDAAEAHNKALALLSAGPMTLMNSGVLSSLNQTFEMLNGGRKVSTYAERTAASFIPAASLLKDIAIALDPVQVDSTKFGATFLSYLPFARGEAQPLLNVFGEPVKAPGPWIIQRLVTWQDKDDPDATFLARNGLRVSALDAEVAVGTWLTQRDKPRSAGGLASDRRFRAEILDRLSNGYLTPDERTTLLRTTGPQIRQVVAVMRQQAAKGRAPEQSDLNNAISRIRRRAMLDLIK